MIKVFVDGAEAEANQKGEKENEFWVKIEGKWHLIFIGRKGVIES